MLVPTIIILWTVFRWKSANSEGLIFAAVLRVMVPIMENARQKKKLISAFRVYALITLSGFITAFDITPASTDDRDGLRDLMSEQYDISVIGDKGYVGEQLKEDMEAQNICLLALKRNNSKMQWSKPFRQMIFKFHRRVETVFSQLSQQLNAERVLAKTFRGLCTRLVNKILAYDLALLMNKLFYSQHPLACIKHLIF